MTTVDGLVLSERSVGETGKSITLLTGDLGCIEVFVRGGRKSKKSISSTQLFCYASFSLEEKRDAASAVHYYYNSSEPKRIFYNLRLDAKKTALACYFAELLRFSHENGDNGPEVMRLALNTLYFLDKGEHDPELLRAVFELRLLCDTGYRPDLIGCCHCYKTEDDEMHFDLSRGRLECKACLTEHDPQYDVIFDKTMLYIVRYIALVDQERLFGFRVSPRCLSKLCDFTERFVRYHYGKRFETLKFYKML